jgi:hypothetical protein
LAKFGGKPRASNKDSEVANGSKAALSNICSDLMELLELKSQFTSSITRSGAFGNVNARVDRGTMKPFAWWSYHVEKLKSYKPLHLESFHKFATLQSQRETGQRMGSAIQSRETNSNHKRKKTLCPSTQSFAYLSIIDRV